MEVRMRNQRNQARHHVGLILAFVGLISGATLALKPARLASAQAVPPSWSFTGNLNAGRDSHTATLLPNGKVLVAGGVGGGAVLNSAELYDPVTGTWSNTGKLNSGRYSHTATLLSNGKVLIARGGGGDHTYLSSAEVYDLATGTWGCTGTTNRARADHIAMLLPNGKVMVAGGAINCGNYCSIHSAELYDPATGSWSLTGNLNDARALHTVTLLSNGKVLIAGGVIGVQSLNGAELY